MSDQWLCLIDGRKLGPLTFTRLQQLAETGRLKPDDYVRRANNEQWLAARNVPNLIPSPSISVDRAETCVPGPKRRQSSRLPVAQAIGDAAIADEIPRGKVLSGPASGSATAPVPAASAPFVIRESKPGHSGAGVLHGRSKQRDRMPLMLGGAAAAGVLVILLILVVSGVINLSGDAPSMASPGSEQPSAKSPRIEFDGEEANPDDFEVTPKDVARKKAPENRETKQNALLASVKQFRDVSKLRNIKLSPAQIEVTGLWLSATDQGEPYVASSDTEGDKAAKFLVIKLQIDNAPGAAPMEYQCWGNEAVLFDDADQVIQPLQPGKMKERIVKQKIDAGGSLVDTLVFPLENVNFGKLRLVLPHETVGIKDRGSFGLELPRHALGRGLENKLVKTSTSSVAVQASDSEESAAIQPKPATPTPQTKADAAKPKTEADDEFIRKLEARGRELDKMEQKK